MLFEISVIALLLFANGIFAMSELAVMSSRRSRLREMAAAGSASAQQALALAEEPTRFLSVVQVGITLVGTLAGAFGGATLAEDLAVEFATFPALAPYAESLALALVVVVLTYCSVLLGELVPKGIAMHNPEGVATVVAGPMSFLSRLAGPLVRLFAFSTDLILKPLRIEPGRERVPTEEELRLMVEEGAETGAFHQSEADLVEGVLSLDSITVDRIMTPRRKIVWLDLEQPDAVNWRRIISSGHSHFPVFRGRQDDLVGIASVKSLWAAVADGKPPKLADVVAPPYFVPETATVTRLLESFRQAKTHQALVVDEFGSVIGLVTLIDVMETIVGDINNDPNRGAWPAAVAQPDGSWLVRGEMDMDELEDLLQLASGGEESEDYRTVGGFVTYHLGHIATPGDAVEWGGYHFEVRAMDRQRVDQVLVRRVDASPETPPA